MGKRHKGESSMTQEEINAKFTYTPPTSEQVKAIEDVMLAGKILIETLKKHVPDAEEDKSWILDRVYDNITDARDAILYPTLAAVATEE